MSITDPNTLLEAMGAQVNKRRILITVIGVKRRLRLPDGTWSKRVPMSKDCKEIVVHCIGPGFAEPSKKQKARCLKFLKDNEYSPDSFEWQEGKEPVLKIQEPDPAQYRPSHTDEENDL